MHSLLSIYLSDLVASDAELPRSFSMAVTRAIFSTKGNEYVSWSEFRAGFPIAVRQRKFLWKQWIDDGKILINQE